MNRIRKINVGVRKRTKIHFNNLGNTLLHINIIYYIVYTYILFYFETNKRYFFITFCFYFMFLSV